jgi:Acetyltransferase (GNAT) domain
MWTQNLVAYQRICAENTDKFPIFFQPWWLDAACGNGYWVPYVHEESSTVWPVYYTRKWGIAYCTVPPLTPRLGWKSASKTLPSILINDPINTLYSLQHFDNEQVISDWFKHKNYQIIPKPYFKLDQPIILTTALKTLRPTARQRLKKAMLNFEVAQETDVTRLYQMGVRSLSRHGIKNTLGIDQLENIVAATTTHQSGIMLSARNKQGQTVASAFFIWDYDTVYYTLGGFDERIPHNGAPRLLIWEGIKIACEQGKSFEFGGGSDPGVGDTFISMGGQKGGYFRAVRYKFGWIRQVITRAKKIYAPNDIH